MISAHRFAWLIAGIVCTMMISSTSWAQAASTSGAQTRPFGYAIKYEREGGYFGAHDELWIYPDGRVIDAAGKVAQVPPDAVRRWVKNIVPVAASSLEATLPPLPLCMDCITYRITLYEKDSTRILVLSDATRAAAGVGERDLEDMSHQLRSLTWK